MLSKTAPCFALVVTGTFSKFLACITVVFLFCWGEMVSKTALWFALVPYPNSKRVLSSFLFFCLGKMVTLTALSVALVIAGTYVESLPRTRVLFSYIFRCHVLASRWYRCMTDERVNEIVEVWWALYTNSNSFRNSSRVSNSLDPDKV